MAAVAVEVVYSVVRRTMIAVGGGFSGISDVSSVGGGSTQTDGGSDELFPRRISS